MRERPESIYSQLWSEVASSVFPRNHRKQHRGVCVRQISTCLHDVDSINLDLEKNKQAAIQCNLCVYVEHLQMIEK